MSSSHHKTVIVSIKFEEGNQEPVWNFCPNEVQVDLPATIVYELDAKDKHWSLYNLSNIKVEGDLQHVVGKTCNRARKILVNLTGNSDGATIDFDFVANYENDDCSQRTYTSNDPIIIIPKPG